MFQQLTFTSWDSLPSVGHINGAIDCTVHKRNRVFGVSELFYRNDKKSHFISGQLVVSLEGKILEVSLARGHVNDQGFYNITGTSAFLQKKAVALLADGGYRDKHALVTPDMNNNFMSYIQSFLRLTVEHINSETKSFNFANDKVRCGPEMQMLGLMAIYKIVALKLELFPRYNFKDHLLLLEARLGITMENISQWAQKNLEKKDK